MVALKLGLNAVQLGQQPVLKKAGRGVCGGGQNLGVLRAQLQAGDEPHCPMVLNQARDAFGGNRQAGGGEKAGDTVIGGRTTQYRNVKFLYQVVYAALIADF